MNEPVANDARIITPGAERMRISRQRRREGMRCFTIEMRETEIDRLVALGLLSADGRSDQNAVVQAIYRFLDQSLIGARLNPGIGARMPLADNSRAGTAR